MAIPHPTTAGDECLLRVPAVMARTGFKRSKLYALTAEGKFPKPLKIEGCTVWAKSTIDNWIAEKLRAAGREVR